MLLAVIVPVLIFIIGVGNDDILPQANPDEFEIPFITPEQEEMNKDTLEEIADIIENPQGNVEIDPILLKQSEDCTTLIESASKPNSPDTITDEQLKECNLIAEQIQNQTQKQIEEIIKEKEEEIILPPDVQIPTNSSMDDPFTQLCDQNPSLIVCGKSTSLELITKVLKQDSTGKQTTVETATKIPQFAFFAEDISNIDYKNGKLQFELFIKGDPNSKYVGEGKVDLLIGEQSLYAEPLQVKVDGITDSEGMVDLLFISPTGLTSDLVLFDFTPNFNKFPNESVTPVRLHVIELTISGDREQEFALVNQDAFIMDIARDDIKLLITDQQGIITRVYPSDSRIILKTITGTSEPYFAWTYRIITTQSDFRGNGLGCGSPYVVSDVSYPKPTTGKTYPVPSPTISGISVLDSDKIVVTTVSGGTGSVLDYAKLTRNENYTLKVTSPSILSSDLVYGKSQETKSFTCQQSATVNIISSVSASGYTSGCNYIAGATKTSYSYIVNPTTPLKLGAISCNIPK